MNVIISQNRSNWWTKISLFMVIILFIFSFIPIVIQWPPEISGFWIFLPLLAFFSFIMAINFAWWVVYPKEFSIEISKDFIKIIDQPMMRMKERTFDPKDVKSIIFSSEGGTVLIDSQGNNHLISDILMMKRKEIFEKLIEFHPHITTELK